MAKNGLTTVQEVSKLSQRLIYLLWVAPKQVRQRYLSDEVFSGMAMEVNAIKGVHQTPASDTPRKEASLFESCHRTQ